MEFSKNGVFHSKGVVIAFSNCLKLNAVSSDKFGDSGEYRHFTPLLQKIYRNRIPENFPLTEILDI